MIECSIVPSYLDCFTGFSGNLLPVLIYDLKLRNICLRMVLGVAILKDGASG